MVSSHKNKLNCTIGKYQLVIALLHNPVGEANMENQA